MWILHYTNHVTYCIEPLSRDQTPLINTVAEAATIVRAVNNPHLRTMIDTSSAGLAETESIPDLINRWLPTGMIGHVQVNDPNRRGPGQGEMKFGPILKALSTNGFSDFVAVEPFEYVPDGVRRRGRLGICAGCLKAINPQVPSSNLGR